jgi:hypothetical protein
MKTAHLAYGLGDTHARRGGNFEATLARLRVDAAIEFMCIEGCASEWPKEEK